MPNSITTLRWVERQEARVLCAKLIPHTTSSQNVELIFHALEQAKRDGFNKGVEAGRIFENDKR